LTHNESLYFTHLLPGCFGSGIFINAKCYDDQISSIVDKIYFIDTGSASLEVQSIKAKDCEFGYKRSIFQNKPWIMLGADIKLQEMDAAKAEQIEHLLQILKKNTNNLSHLKSFYQFFMNKMPGNKPDSFKTIENDRNGKKHFDYPSCGSVFKNNYEYGTPTGVIIDHLGLKGKIKGGAMISQHHGNFIINYNRAAASDVLYLIKTVQEKVHNACGFIPEPEVILYEQDN
jgi:UDP-N-acetylmuramate dehydrogenase